MRARLRFVLGVTAAALVVAAPLVYSAHDSRHLRNFRVVENGVLYRSGQPTPTGLDRVIREYGIKTVVTLRASKRNTYDSPQDAWEEDVCAARGLNHVRIVPRVWGADEKGEIPAEQAVQEFLAVMEKKENHPVLVHCFAGIHRTGTMCAVFRMQYHGWSAERAMAEMQLYGFDPEDMHEHISVYLREYEARKKAAK
ncbi:MAG TPA: dual specificity protein phosphatase family protein [Gemmata sp.]